MADHDPGLQLDDELVARAHGHMARGIYDSLDHVVIAAFEALDREAEAFDAMVCEKIAEALADPEPLIPMEEAFARLRGRLEAKRTA